jgi:hypothetical protein
MPIEKVEIVIIDGKTHKKTTFKSGATALTQVTKNPDKQDSLNIQYLKKIMQHLGIPE